MDLRFRLALCSLISLQIACRTSSPADETASATAETGSTNDGGGATDPVEVEPDPWLEIYAKVQAEAAVMDLDGFLSTYPAPPTVETLSYDPLQAVGLDAIEQVLPLTSEQESALASNGFVVLRNARAPTFEHAYHSIYFADLPVVVTSDSILYALHRSFDAILLAVEQQALIPELDALLRELHEALADGVAQGTIAPSMAAAIEDLDVYLTVARSLSQGVAVAPVTGASAEAQVERIQAAIVAESVATLELFGLQVTYDFSQFKPRGHYEDVEHPELARYFKTMMWLGRTDMALVHFPEGEAVFNRRAFDAAVLLHDLMQHSSAIDRWSSIDRVLRTIMGEPDSMSPGHMPQLLDALGTSDLAAIAALPDATVFQKVAEGDYGLQRIMSQIMFSDPTDPPLVLPRVFLLLGQRFTIDSYVFNNVTYDRVKDLRTGTKVPRMLPDELDVQFVLGANRAGHHLAPELTTYGYQGILHELRFLVDSHPPEFWDESFYNGWLSGIRALNPAQEERAAYPEPMRTGAWLDKALNTQAASRAELRHDTLLYAKQSYSAGNACEYPDGYVEPVAGFYARMRHIGALGQGIVQEIEAAGYEIDGAAEYFAHWSETMAMLESIAVQELAGEVLTGEQIAFLGQTIEQEIVGCGVTQWDGWYAGLFFDRSSLGDSKPTVADVHTAPTDAGGSPKGWVLHAATGQPRMMIMTVPQCDGSATAYIGPVSGYHQVLTENYTRMTDSEWASRLEHDPPPAPEWTQSFQP